MPTRSTSATASFAGPKWSTTLATGDCSPSTTPRLAWLKPAGFNRGAISFAGIDFAREQKLFLAAFNHLVPFPGTPQYRRLEQEGRLLSPRWWLDPQGRVGDVVFRPKKLSAADLQALCLDARRQFYSWRSIAQRFRDGQANARSWLTVAVYLGLNIDAHFDIDRRQGLQLGAGLKEWVHQDEPLPV